ncbi:MAG: hypothetical protein KAH14_05385 [Clostridiales bacterium]|nr:hypothetical protein [Clostridiales bacterium]
MNKSPMKFASLPEPDFGMDGFFTVTLKRESYIEGNVGDNVGDNVGIKLYDTLKEAFLK